VIDHRAATWTTLTPETVAAGARVEIRGPSLSPTGELVATSVAPVGLPTAGVWGRHTKLEGFITAHDAGQVPVRFTLSGVRVEVAQNAKYDGVRPSDWLGGKVQVEGWDQPDGSVVAWRVRFVQRTPIRIRARVDSVSLGEGTFVALGITIDTEPLTRMTDESAIHAQPFGLANLVAGDYVYVVGVDPDDSGVVVASIVERQDPQDETLLQAYVRPVPPGGFYWGSLPILGVTAHSNAATRYPTPNGGNLNAATFYCDISSVIRPLVEVRGTKTADGTIVATEMRLVDWF
jgi:hypothetical protein